MKDLEFMDNILSGLNSYNNRSACKINRGDSTSLYLTASPAESALVISIEYLLIGININAISYYELLHLKSFLTCGDSHDFG